MLSLCCELFLLSMRDYLCCIFFIVLVALGSCTSQEINKAMDSAEELMNSRPDSALAILNDIPSSSLHGDKAKARYALLKSMALDKNYVDTTTFDVLQPAIDYYLKKGTPNDKLRTYYYQARIYQNRGEYESAMQSFLRAADFKEETTDTLLLAHTLVAQGTIFIEEEKLKEHIECNALAAKLYKSLGKDLLSIKSISNVALGYIEDDEPQKAVETIKQLENLVKEFPEGEHYYFTPMLLYTVEYGSTEEIRDIIDKYKDHEMLREDYLNLAYGYSKIGKHEEAFNALDITDMTGTVSDSLKYVATKTLLLENQKKYEEAYKSYHEFSEIMGRYHYKLISDNLLFAETKHEMELEHIKSIQQKNHVIWYCLLIVAILLLISSWLYYKNRLNNAKRLVKEKEKEKAELELVTLTLEKEKLEREQENLNKLLKEKDKLTKSIHPIIKKRLELLNSLLVTEITKSKKPSKSVKEWIDSIRNDQQQFMDSTRLAYMESHPEFIKYWESKGFTVDEINVICLYAIGFKGKEIGDYINTKKHYIISSSIRKKLNLNEHDMNLGRFIKLKLESSDTPNSNSE